MRKVPSGVRAAIPRLSSLSVALLLFVTGCPKGKTGLGDAGPAASTSASAGTSSASGSSGFGGAAALLPSSPIDGWGEARTGDPLELARLADREGVHALAEVASSPTAIPDDRTTAIRALAYVDDPTPAVDALTHLATDGPVERSTLALETLAAVAPKRAPIEELDPGAWRTCGEGLLSMLKSLVDPVRRELAIRALIGLADRGAVARTAIPER